MPDRFDIPKHTDSIPPDDFYRFIWAYYLHQDGLSWSRTQNLLAIEGGVLAAAFLKGGWVAIFALAAGSILVLLVWHLIQRDWQVRDQFDLYFKEFHKDWGITLAVPPKGYWYRGRNIVQAITWLVIAVNLLFMVVFVLDGFLHLRLV